jgi:hypothetical protein
MAAINPTDVCAQTGCGLQAQYHAQVGAQVPVSTAGVIGYYTETLYVCPQSLHSEQTFIAQSNFGT